MELSGISTDVDEELREVSTELAGSIRRELELEDLVDRLQLEASQGPDLGRRTSDYFSDSGSGSYRYAMSDGGAGKAEDLAKQKRLSEQEKAQFKLSYTQKLHVERAQRKALKEHVRRLADQVQHVSRAYKAKGFPEANDTRWTESVQRHLGQLVVFKSLKAPLKTIDDGCKRSGGSKKILRTC